MKDGAKGIGALLFMIFGFIYNALVIVLPLDAVIGHFCSSFVTWLCIFLFFLAYQFIPLVPDIIIHIMYIIGIPYVWTDFPRYAFVIYIAFMLSVYIRTITKTIINRPVKNKYDQMIQDFIEHPEDDVDIDEFDTNNDEDDYDYYR